MKKRIIFICTHNSARSQMAEALLRALYGDKYEVFSAGTDPRNLNPFAIAVMEEIGIDISKHRSKNVKEFLGEEFDLVVTVCDQAKESCPFLPGGKKYIHKGFEDPSNFKGDDKEVLSAFRKVRDKIKNWIEEAFGEKGELFNEIISNDRKNY